VKKKHKLRAITAFKIIQGHRGRQRRSHGFQSGGLLKSPYRLRVDGRGPKGRKRGWGFWGGAVSPLPTSYGVWGSAVSSPQRGSGRSPGRPAVFTALHIMQTRYSKENSVRLSVRPSVRLSVTTRVIPDKTEERSVQIFIPYERIFILVF